MSPPCAAVGHAVRLAGTLDLAEKQGCGLEVIFRKYDTSGEGHLDANEVRHLVCAYVYVHMHMHMHMHMHIDV